MKRDISAILILCLILQLYGCMGSYEYNEITLEELKSYSGSEEIIINTNQGEYSLQRAGWGRVLTDWQTEDSSIAIINKDVILGNNGDIVIADTVRIYYSEIQKIEMEKWENFTALEVTGTILVVLTIVGLLILVVADSFQLSNEDVWKALDKTK